MKLAKRFAALLMGATLAVGSALGLAGCDLGGLGGNGGNGGSAGTDNTQSGGSQSSEMEEQIRAVYELYAANCAENNVTPQTYEQWLASIKGAKGDKGDPGANGITPTIGDDDMWWIGDQPTEFKAVGKDGVTPSISNDGYWVFGETKTQYKAVAENGKSAYELYWQSYKGEGNPLSEEEWLASLKGDQGDKGDKGNGWLFGDAVPDDELGEDGDLYLDTFTWNVYAKQNGTWGEPLGNIKGKDGTGDAGGSETNAITLHAGESHTVDVDVEAGQVYELSIDLIEGEVTEWGLVVHQGEAAFDKTKFGTPEFPEGRFHRLYDANNNRYWGALLIEEGTTKLTFTTEKNIKFTYELAEYKPETLKADGVKRTVPTTFSVVNLITNINNLRNVQIPLDDTLSTGKYTVTITDVPALPSGAAITAQRIYNSNGFTGATATNKVVFVNRSSSFVAKNVDFSTAGGSVCFYASMVIDYNVTIQIDPAS